VLLDLRLKCGVRHFHSLHAPSIDVSLTFYEPVCRSRRHRSHEHHRGTDLYRDVLGLTPGRPETADGATIVSLHFGDVDVELLEPSDPQGPVAKFLAKRGPASTTSATACPIWRPPWHGVAQQAIS